MNIEVDKLLWRKIDALDSYTYSNTEFYDSFQRIMEHHRKTIALFAKNLEAEEDMIDRLTSQLNKKKNFIMFKDLLPYFRDMFTALKNKWENKLEQFNDKMWTPLQLQFSKSKIIEPELKSCKKRFVRLMDYLENISKAKKSYHNSCKTFQESYIR